MFEEGQLIDNEALINSLGTEKQMRSFRNNGKLQTNIKKSLLKDLGSLVEYREFQIGRKKYYEITRVFDQKELVKNKLADNRNKYKFAFEQLLLNYFNKLDKEDYFSNSKILEGLGIFNDNYKKGFYNTKFIIDATGIDKDIVNTFFRISYTETSRLIKRYMTMLSDENKIDCDIGIVIISGEISRMATKEENEIIGSIQKKCIDDFNCKSLRKIYSSGLNKKYNQLVLKEIKELKLDVDYFYNGYLVRKVKTKDIFNEDEDVILKYLRKKIVKKIKEVSKYLKDYYKRKAEESVEFGSPIFNRCEQQRGFIKSINKLIDFCID